ncbi:MAG TPA: hypothetical protein DCF62_02235 [Porticoccaceae bacterium]|nr:hypothetical protein [Porticoccaceae bacterium]
MHRVWNLLTYVLQLSGFGCAPSTDPESLHYTNIGTDYATGDIATFNSLFKYLMVRRDAEESCNKIAICERGGESLMRVSDARPATKVFYICT